MKMINKLSHKSPIITVILNLLVAIEWREHEDGFIMVGK